jgi:hypothetical protein
MSQALRRDAGADSVNMDPRLNTAGLVRVAPSELVRLLNDSTLHAKVYHLDGSTISDCDSFFASIRASLPLDPPVLTCNWNALSDSLWEGLYSPNDSKIVIFWRDAETMKTAAPLDYETATCVLGDVAATLNDSAATVGHPKTLTVVLDA